MGYEGQCLEVNGFYLAGNGTRAYSPSLKRFVQADSYSPFLRATENSYAFNLGDPVNRVDPTGHASLPAMISLIVSVKRWVNRVRPVTIGKRYSHFVEDAQELFMSRAPSKEKITNLHERYLFPSGFLRKKLSTLKGDIALRKDLFRQTAKIKRTDIFEKIYPNLDRQLDAERAVLQRILNFRDSYNIYVGNWID